MKKTGLFLILVMIIGVGVSINAAQLSSGAPPSYAEATGERPEVTAARCPMCTYQNTPGAVRCEICGAVLPKVAQPMQPAQPMLPVNPGQPEQGEIRHPARRLSQESVKGIVCPHCTYENKPGAVRCEMCQAPLRHVEQGPQERRLFRPKVPSRRGSLRGSLGEDKEDVEQVMVTKRIGLDRLAFPFGVEYRPVENIPGGRGSLGWLVFSKQADSRIKYYVRIRDNGDNTLDYIDANGEILPKGLFDWKHRAFKRGESMAEADSTVAQEKSGKQSFKGVAKQRRDSKWVTVRGQLWDENRDHPLHPWLAVEFHRGAAHLRRGHHQQL